MTRTKFSENSIYSQVFSFEVLNYFDSIATEENIEWIIKYFNLIMKKENENAEKFEIHHIRPCCTFKDETHKNRKQTKPLANKFNGNMIRLSIYNHIFAHFYLWKIFNIKDLKEAFQRMCGQRINNLTENELQNIAKLKEECAKKNKTKEEFKASVKQWYEEHKEEKLKKDRERYYKNRDQILKRKKIYSENNKEKIAKRYKEYYENSKEDILKRKREDYAKNKEKIRERCRNNIKAKERENELNARLCIDPIKGDTCTYKALRNRKSRHKDLYKGIIPKDCLIKPQS